MDRFGLLFRLGGEWCPLGWPLDAVREGACFDLEVPPLDFVHAPLTSVASVWVFETPLGVLPLLLWQFGYETDRSSVASLIV